MFRLIAPAVYRCVSASHVGATTASAAYNSSNTGSAVSAVREPTRGVYTGRLSCAGRLSRSCDPVSASSLSTHHSILGTSRRGYTADRHGGGGGAGAGGKDYYKILGIAKNADVKEIKKAYRKRALETHPDQGGNKEEFAEVAEAYEILSSPEKRQVYDQYGSEAAQNANMAGASGGGGFGGRSAEDIFAEFFKGGFGDMFGGSAGGGRGGGGASRGPPTVPPIEVKLRLTLEEVYSGVHKSVRVTRPQICTECDGHGTKSKQPKQKCTHCHGNGHVVQHHRLGPGMVQQTVTECGRCHGSGTAARAEDQCTRCHGNGYRNVGQEVSVDIPAGVPSNVTLVMRGEGGVVPGAQPGDLHVHIEIATHRVFQRRGNDLIVEKEVTLEEALLGLQLPLKLLDGRTVSVQTTHESILKPDGVIKVRGEGMTSSTGTRGDVYVFVRLKMPHKLSPDQRQHIQSALGEPKKDVHAVPGNIVKGRVMHETRSQLEEQKQGLWAAQEGMGGRGHRGSASANHENGPHRHAASEGMSRGECAAQ